MNAVLDKFRARRDWNYNAGYAIERVNPRAAAALIRRANRYAAAVDRIVRRANRAAGLA